ncbi:MAG: hypothetical protein ACK6CT_06600 [Planctomycetia bacterium]|jgi:hypothetical protein
MKALLVLLAVVTLLAALFLGGCAVSGIHAYVTMPANAVMYRELHRDIAVVSTFGLAGAVAILIANGFVLPGLFRNSTPRRRLVARVLGACDVVLAGAALAWLVWADRGWAAWPWTWLAKAGAVALALKGVLIWRLVGRSATAATDTRAG